MAFNAEDFEQIPEWGLWLRLPVQAILIGWGAWAGGLLARRA